MPKLLQAAGPMGKAGWAPFQTLLVAQLQFLEPYLRTARLHESVRLLYQACTLCPPVPLLHRFRPAWFANGRPSAITLHMQRSASGLSPPERRVSLDGVFPYRMSGSLSNPRTRAPRPGT